MDYWRCYRVSRMDKLTNEEVKQTIGIEKDTLDYIDLQIYDTAIIQMA